MVSVQMADHDGIDLPRVQALGLQRGEAGRSAVHQRGEPLGLQPIAGLEPSPAAERVAATHEPDLHHQSLAASTGRQPPKRRVAGFAPGPSNDELATDTIRKFARAHRRLAAYRRRRGG
jgi:hypothetical protein